MAGRSGRRRVDPSSPLVDLDVVFADDALVDAISARTGSGPSRGSLLTADPLTELLESWQHELAGAPLPDLPSIQATVPIEQSPTPPRRALRPALAIAAAIAALLVGSATISAKDATPDSALWAITEVLWPSRAQSVESVGHVQAALDEAKWALDDHRPQDAQIALLRATVELGNVDDVDGRSTMQEQVVTLWAQAAPQNLPLSTQPPEYVTAGRPTGTDARSSATGSTVSSAPAAVPLLAAAAAPAEVLPTQISPTKQSSTTAQQAAGDAPVPTVRPTAASVGSGSSGAPDSSAAPSSAPAEVPSTPTASAAPAAPSVPSTPPPPTVNNATAVVPADQPAAPAQTVPAPTPSQPAVTDPTGTDQQDVTSGEAASSSPAGATVE